MPLINRTRYFFTFSSFVLQNALPLPPVPRRHPSHFTDSSTDRPSTLLSFMISSAMLPVGLPTLFYPNHRAVSPRNFQTIVKGSTKIANSNTLNSKFFIPSKRDFFSIFSFVFFSFFISYKVNLLKTKDN